MRRARSLALLMATFLVGAASAAPMGERLAPCLACHGEGGTSLTEGVPSLGAQMPDYIVTQLFQFREGQRQAPPMNAMAAGLSDDDLRSYADALGTLPPPVPSGGAPDPELATRAQALIAKHQCNSCHTADLTGRDNIPRIRGQREEYLAAALTGYRSNTRPGYDPAMNEAAQGLKDGEIRDLAAYIARL
ncbi:c-type cytochrome [Methylobacterium goesingense]|uniref:Cytochrome c553 n=1 Tax=Methylobacterium goesingense TaxID=243690 RepID=A0ABV2L9Y8_9HYPH|nr:c-type cytochrome [Methylobacterium goesingense]GJD76557.1 Cytochrome c-552 [Methylobacterium goesingense]